jgi:hypothetical protein
MQSAIDPRDVDDLPRPTRSDSELPFGLDRPTPRLALLGCVLLGVASLALPSALGYDPWAWLVWGRELFSLDLDTTGGPSWKPLPPLLIAPFSLYDPAAPSAWLVIARAAAFAAPLLAFRITFKLTASRFAGLAAAAGVFVCADFFVTALRGYSEPLLIALVLAGFDQHLHGRPRAALWALTLAGLLRPEVWPFALAYGLHLAWASGAGRVTARGLRLAAVPLLAPALWILLDLAGSGNALESSHVAQTSPLGSAAKADHPALTVIGRAGDAVILPVLILALVGLVVAIRRRRSVVLAISAMALAWIGIVAVMAEAGFTGRRRYLAVAAALMCVVAATGLDASLRAAERRQARAIGVVAAIVVFVVFAVFAFSPLRTDYRLIGLAGRQQAQLDELRDAVQRAGGPARIRAFGEVVVNPFVQTALAWEIGGRLAGVTATWSSSRLRPGWTAPATLFRAPEKLAGHRPAIPPDVRTRRVTRAGRWRVIEASPGGWSSTPRRRRS